ncbi:MAG: hypothetical protein Q9221_002119 [Calogaya cf. arnoldii]
MNKGIVILSLNAIVTFRSQAPGQKVWLDEDARDSLTKMDETAYQNIEHAVKRIKKVAEMAGKQARRIEQMELFQRLLSLDINKQETASLPCNTLPVARNQRFYGREDILVRLDKHLTPADTSSRLSSVALHGLGGVGKTQIALAYGYRNLDALDAVLWIAADDAYTVQQDFSHVATDALKLPNAHPHAHQENMVLVLDWLQKTRTKWLLIFDNVDSHDMISNCWPVSKHGAILVTTRDVVVATLPIDTGLEVNEFGVAQGAEFLLQMTPNRRRQDRETKSAEDVARQLGGLPLALNQMAALVNARNLSLKEFGDMYTKHDQRLHEQKKSGSKYLGYKYSLDTVCELSFDNLGDDARAWLGVLSFLAADSVPLEVFTWEKPENLPTSLAFCEDELRYVKPPLGVIRLTSNNSLADALDELTHHALVRKNTTQGTFRLHRLVQMEYRSRLANPQDAFDTATQLLLGKFPSQRENKYNDDEWLTYERYMPQVLALTRNYNNSQSKARPLKPNMDFVNLLAVAVNAIHDNDTANVNPWMLATADAAYRKCPEDGRDRLLWAFLQSLRCMYHLSTAEFTKAEEEGIEALNIQLELLSKDDLLITLSYSWLGMAVGGQERYEDGLELLLKASKVLEGPAGETPSQKMVWRYNTSRNYYCMGRFVEAEGLLSLALAEAERSDSWYQQV